MVIEGQEGQQIAVDVEDIANQEILPIHHPRNHFQRGQQDFGGMSYNEVEEALQSQGFSMENFYNLPMEIQDDILNNIR